MPQPDPLLALSIEIGREHVATAWRLGLSYPEIGQAIHWPDPVDTYEEAVTAVAAAWRALPAILREG